MAKDGLVGKDEIEEIKKELLKVKAGARAQVFGQHLCAVWRYTCGDKWHIGDLRGGEAYRSCNLERAAKIIHQIDEREKIISKRIAEEVKSLHEQEKWEARHSC